MWNLINIPTFIAKLYFWLRNTSLWSFYLLLKHLASKQFEHFLQCFFISISESTILAVARGRTLNPCRPPFPTLLQQSSSWYSSLIETLLHLAAEVVFLKPTLIMSLYHIINHLDSPLSKACRLSTLMFHNRNFRDLPLSSDLFSGTFPSDFETPTIPIYSQIPNEPCCLFHLSVVGVSCFKNALFL